MSTEKNPSRNWYFAPLVGGIVGGIIAYYGLKDRNISFAKRILWIGVAVTALQYIISFGSILSIYLLNL